MRFYGLLVCLALAPVYPDSGIAKTKKTDQLLIDLRNPKAFAAAHIEGSLNMSVSQLAARRWMAPKKITLIGDTLTPMSEPLARLKSAGFQTLTVMEGGLQGHVLSGGKLIGNHTRSIQPGLVKMPQLVLALHDRDWLLVDLAGSVETPSLDGFLVTPSTANRIEIENRIHELSAQKASAYLLLLDRQGEHRDTILNTLRRIGDGRIFYLAGGKQTWLAHTQGSKSGTRRVESGNKSCGCKK